MDETPDLTSLARRWLDLWQEQVTALAGDPAVAEQTARLLGLLEGGAAAWRQASSQGQSARDGTGGTATRVATAEATASSPSSAAGGHPLGSAACPLFPL